MATCFAFIYINHFNTDERKDMEQKLKDLGIEFRLFQYYNSALFYIDSKEGYDMIKLTHPEWVIQKMG